MGERTWSVQELCSDRPLHALLLSALLCPRPRPHQQCFGGCFVLWVCSYPPHIEQGSRTNISENFPVCSTSAFLDHLLAEADRVMMGVQGLPFLAGRRYSRRAEVERTGQQSLTVCPALLLLHGAGGLCGALWDTGGLSPPLSCSVEYVHGLSSTSL